MTRVCLSYDTHQSGIILYHATLQYVQGCILILAWSGYSIGLFRHDVHTRNMLDTECHNVSVEHMDTSVQCPARSTKMLSPSSFRMLALATNINNLMINIHTHTNTYTHTYMYTYTHAQTHTHTYIYIYIYILYIHT